MAITVPVAGQEISAATFGAPVANQLNHEAGRIWVNALTAVDANAGWTDIPGSTVLPSEQTARKWRVTVNLTIDAAQTGLPKAGYIRLYLNGGIQYEYAIYLGVANSTLSTQFSIANAAALSSCKLALSGFRISSGQMTFIDGGP